MLSDWTCWCSVLAKPLVSLVLLLPSLIVLSGASSVLSDWACWCSVLAKPLVLLLWSLIVVSGASSVLSDWTCWCSVLAKPLVSLVLLLRSLIVLSGASFVLSDSAFWCSVLAKPLVFFVLLLWSLIVIFLRGAHGDKDSRNWPTLPWTGCLPRCFSAPLLVLRLVLSGASAGAPFVASPCAFLGGGDFYFACCINEQ